MSVASMLSHKDSEAIITVTKDQSIADAVALLAEKKIGAVVVVDDARAVAGILSERDIVRGLSDRGASIMTQSVGDLMTAPVETCTRSETVDDVMRRMTEGRFRHMPVTEAGELVGVISIGDVVKNRIKDLEYEAEALRDYVMS